MAGSVARISADKHDRRDPRKLGRRSSSDLPDPKEGVRLIKAFLSIDDAEARRALIELAEALARGKA
jgi:hypothetical protein